MKQQTLRTVTAITLIICLLLSMCCLAYAEERTIVSTSSSFVRNSTTKGTATLSAVSSNPSTPYMRSVMTLQEAPLGTDDFVDSNVDPEEKTSSINSIMHTATFKITTTKEYRVKMEITDVTAGAETTRTIYEDLQE